MVPCWFSTHETEPVRHRSPGARWVSLEPHRCECRGRATSKGLHVAPEAWSLIVALGFSAPVLQTNTEMMHSARCVFQRSLQIQRELGPKSLTYGMHGARLD